MFPTTLWPRLQNKSKQAYSGYLSLNIRRDRGQERVHSKKKQTYFLPKAQNRFWVFRIQRVPETLIRWSVDLIRGLPPLHLLVRDRHRCGSPKNILRRPCRRRGHTRTSQRAANTYQRGHKGAISNQMSAGVTGFVQTRHRAPRQPGQLKEHTGFLVSRSLILPAAPLWADDLKIFELMIFPVPIKNALLRPRLM